MSSDVQGSLMEELHSLNHLQATRLTAALLKTRLFVEKHSRILRGLLVMLAVFAFNQLVPFYPAQILLLLCAGLAVAAYWFPRFSIALGTVLIAPACFYQDTILGIIVGGLVLLTLYMASKDWRIAALSIMIVSALSSNPFFFVGGTAVVICSMLFGQKFGTFTSTLTVLWMLILQIAKGGQVGLIPLPYLPSNVIQQLGLTLPEFHPSSLVNIFQSAFSRSAHSNAIYANLIDSTLGRGSMFFYVNLAAWIFAGWIPAFIIDRILNKKRSLAFLFGSLAGTIVILVPSVLALEWNSLYFNPFISVGNLNTSVGFAVLTTVAAVSFSPILNPFDRFMFSEWPKVSRIASFLYAVGPFEPRQLEVGGYDKVKAEIAQCILWPLERRDIIDAYRLETPRGALVVGCDGVGKTKLILSCAARTKATLFVIKCSEIDYSAPDTLIANLERIFDIFSRFRPCLIVFLDVDRIMGAGQDIHNDIKWAFLDGLDEISKYEDAIPIGITEFDGEINRELFAPGRLEKIVYVELPDASTREEMLRTHLKGRPYSPKMDFADLAHQTERFTDIEIEEVCATASLLAAEQASSSGRTEPITQDHFAEALASRTPKTPVGTERALGEQFERMKRQSAGIRVRVRLRKILMEP